MYSDANPKDTIRIKYDTVENTRKTIRKLESLRKSKRYTHARIVQVANVMTQRLRVIYDKTGKAKTRYDISKRYFEKLKRQSGKSKKSRKKSRRKSKKSRRKSKPKKYRKQSRMIDIKNYWNEEWRQIPLHIRKFSTNREKEELVRLLRIVYFRYQENPDECNSWFDPEQIYKDMDNDNSIFITLIDNLGVIYAIASIESIIPITDPSPKTVYFNTFCSLWPKYIDDFRQSQNVNEIIDPWNRGMTRRSIMQDGRRTPLGKTLALLIIESLKNYNVYSIIGNAIGDAQNFWYNLPGVEQVPDEQFIYSPEIDLWPQFHGIPRQAGDLDINMRFILQ